MNNPIDDVIERLNDHIEHLKRNGVYQADIEKMETAEDIQSLVKELNIQARMIAYLEARVNNNIVNCIKCDTRLGLQHEIYELTQNNKALLNQVKELEAKTVFNNECIKIQHQAHLEMQHALEKAVKTYKDNNHE